MIIHPRINPKYPLSVRQPDFLKKYKENIQKV